MTTILRTIKYLVLAVLALGILTLSLANRTPVTLQLFPDDVAAFLGYNQTVELPMFLVILIGVAVGLLIGFIWEWLREHRIRSEAARARAEAKRLKAELGRQADPRAGEGADVLALLDEGKGGARAAR
jgi:putative membrane protein